MQSLYYTSLAEPHTPSAQARGSGCKPTSSFVPAARILQSNQIAERPITECRHVNVATLVVCTLQGYVSHGSERSSEECSKRTGLSRAKIRAVRSCGDVCEGTVDVFLCFQQGMGRVSASVVCLLCSINCWVEKNTAPL